MVRSRLNGSFITSLAGVIWLKALILSVALIGYTGAGCQTGGDEGAKQEEMAPEEGGSGGETGDAGAEMGGEEGAKKNHMKKGKHHKGKKGKKMKKGAKKMKKGAKKKKGGEEGGDMGGEEGME